MSQSATTSPPGMQGSGNGMNILVAFLHVFATSIQVFLRYDFGKRYLGVQAVLVLFFVPFFTLLFPGYDLRPLLLLWPAYLGVCGIHRVRYLLGFSKTAGGHSFYNGRPLLTHLLPRLAESWIKRFSEPALVVLAGWMVSQVNVPLGAYLSVGGISLFVMENLLAIREEQQATDLNDAVIEQQLRAERFRHTRGER